MQNNNLAFTFATSEVNPLGRAFIQITNYQTSQTLRSYKKPRAPCNLIPNIVKLNRVVSNHIYLWFE